MDQRANMVARSTTFNLPLTSAVHPHYQQPQPPQPPPQQALQQQQPPQQQQQQQQQARAVQIQVPQNRAFHSPQDAAEAQSRMEDALKRSVTVVFWYQAGKDPLRLHLEIETFPFFSLSLSTPIVSELPLGIQPNSYIDSYNPQAGTWEQQPANQPRSVSRDQRLLYRIRKSLFEGLSDRDCPGLESEIRMQQQQSTSIQNSVQIMSPPQKSLKRPMPDSSTDVSAPAAKHFRPSMSSPFVMGQNGVPAQAFVQGVSAQAGPSGSPLNTHGHQSLSPGMHPTSPFLRQDSAVMAQPADQAMNETLLNDGSSLHPQAKRWPNDYAVCEISLGFDKMDELIAHSPSTTQKAAFEAIFGCRYVKSTVCRHRGVWRRADKNLKESFKRMGTDERALWGEFVKKTDFRREGQKPKSQQQDREEDHLQGMDYGMGSMNTLGLDMVNGVMMNDDPPMASLGPPPG